MKLHVLRNQSTSTGTPGGLTVLETALMLVSLELPWKQNRSGVSCIRAASYSCDIWYSPHLQRNVLRLEDKYGRKDCLVHNGNFAGDADLGFETQVHGCTLVGSAYAQVPVPNTDKTQFGVINSKDSLARLLDNIGPGPHMITYEWAPGCAPEDDIGGN